MSSLSGRIKIHRILKSPETRASSLVSRLEERHRNWRQKVCRSNCRTLSRGTISGYIFPSIVLNSSKSSLPEIESQKDSTRPGTLSDIVFWKNNGSVDVSSRVHDERKRRTSLSSLPFFFLLPFLVPSASFSWHAPSSLVHNASVGFSAREFKNLSARAASTEMVSNY